VYLVDTRGGVLAVDAATGTKRWSVDGLGPETTGPVLLGES
jgi:outer membrane protein assembly factor BamB